MQVTDFDYAKDRAGSGGSLTKLATLIQKARKEAEEMGVPCLLFDNGDTLQGTPMADFLAREKPGRPNPMVTCMNYLKYDAGGLGNHDFDHGLNHLASALADHRMPVLCSNLSSDALPMVRKSLLLDCPIRPSQPDGPTFKIGVLSSLPQKTELWSRHHVQARAQFDPPLKTLKQEAAKLREAGAEFVIVLAHMGIALFDEGAEAQNLISDVAALADVDVVIGGHTHLRFPGPEHAEVPEADCMKGRVNGTPVVQPGPSASDLGVIDLDLVQWDDPRRCTVTGSEVVLRPVTKAVPDDPGMVRLTEQPHSDTRQFLSQTVARLDAPINSFFALADPSPVPALLAAAKRRAIERAVAGTEFADLPLLAVASAPLTGGFDGPENFINLSSGQLKRHHVAGMNPYANHVWAVKTTGAQLVDWLERSVLIYNTLSPDASEQALVDPRVPGFRYDSIYGLTYEIDLRKPPSYDVSGRKIPGRSARVQNIKWQGAALDEDQQFLVATTDHRAGGGGLYQTFRDADIVIKGDAPLQEAVLEFLTSSEAAEIREARPWCMAPGLSCSAFLLTAPQARAHLDEIAHLHPEDCGENDEGFLKLRLHF
jgi:2',3'-cyclic-nucleotide 2'-phosphodiesterase/3'-nucleotidase